MPVLLKSLTIAATLAGIISLSLANDWSEYFVFCQCLEVVNFKQIKDHRKAREKTYISNRKGRFKDHQETRDHQETKERGETKDHKDRRETQDHLEIGE